MIFIVTTNNRKFQLPEIVSECIEEQENGDSKKMMESELFMKQKPVID